MKRGEIFRSSKKVPVRGNQPGFYLVVSRDFVAENDDVATVICAPVYAGILGLSTELVVGPSEGVPKTSAVRCDFLSLMFKKDLVKYVGALSGSALERLDSALAVALELTLPS